MLQLKIWGPHGPLLGKVGGPMGPHRPQRRAGGSPDSHIYGDVYIDGPLAVHADMLSEACGVRRCA